MPRGGLLVALGCALMLAPAAAFAQSGGASGASGGEKSAETPAPAKRPTCANVINSTAYEYPVTFRSDGQIIGTIKIPGGQKRDVCLAKPSRDPRLKVIVRSFWLEVGRCDVAIRGKVEIIRVKVEGEEITRVKCG